MFPVGNTPLITPESLAKRYGTTNLFLKYDGLNPSGSLKDRASLLVAELALHQGEERVVLASTGNAGSAMACAGAALGLEVVLLVPETAPRAKLLQSILYGARVVPVVGTYDDAFGLSIELSAELGGINRNTAYNPFTTEGKKTVSIEIYNQLGGRVPDYIYVPTGDGVIYGGVHKGFQDLMACGATDSVPKLIMVQAEGSNALARSRREGSEIALSTSKTIADSISVCSPANGEMALKDMRECGGWAVEVQDSAISAAQIELARRAGVFVEPASAAAWAGFTADRSRLDGDATVVVLLTGTGFKDMGALESEVTVPASCPADIDAVAAYLHDATG